MRDDGASRPTVDDTVCVQEDGMLDDTRARGVEVLREAAKDAAYRSLEIRGVLALYVVLLAVYAPSTPPVHLAGASVAMLAGLWLWAEQLGRRLGDVLVARARGLSHEQAVALVDRRTVSVTMVIERFRD